MRGSSRQKRPLPSVASASARLGALHAQHRGVGAGTDDRVEEQLMVVLAPHPRLVGDRRRREQREQLAREIGAGGEAGRERGPRIGRVARLLVGRRCDRARVHGAVAEAVARDVGEWLAVGRERRWFVASSGQRVGARHADRVEEPVEDAEAPGVGDAPDHRRADLPTLAQLEHLVEVARLDDREHPLLALRRHHLDRVHARLALGDARDVDVHARAGLGRRLRRRARQAGRAEVLHADREPGVEQREARLDEPLLLERVADLHRRALGLGPFLEARRREHARAADAVTPGRRAEQHREVAFALGARARGARAAAARGRAR